MKNRIPISEEAKKGFSPSRRSALTRLARIAAACGAIVLSGISTQNAFASGNLGTYQGPDPKDVNFDGR
jgi:hypothetical protein